MTGSSAQPSPRQTDEIAAAWSLVPFALVGSGSMADQASVAVADEQRPLEEAAANLVSAGADPGDATGRTLTQRNIVQQAADPIVLFPRKLLEMLRDCETKLNNYVTAYISSHEICSLSSSIRGRLDKGVAQPKRLIDGDYWEEVQRDLHRVSQGLFVSNSFRQLEFKEAVSLLEDSFRTTQSQFDATQRQIDQNASADTQALVGPAKSLRQTTVSLYQQADDLAKRCEDGSREMLDAMKLCLAQMFAQPEVGATSITQTNQPAVTEAKPKNGDRAGTLAKVKVNAE